MFRILKKSDYKKNLKFLTNICKEKYIASQILDYKNDLEDIDKMYKSFSKGFVNFLTKIHKLSSNYDDRFIFCTNTDKFGYVSIALKQMEEKYIRRHIEHCIKSQENNPNLKNHTLFSIIFYLQRSKYIYEDTYDEHISNIINCIIKELKVKLNFFKTYSISVEEIYEILTTIFFDIKPIILYFKNKKMDVTSPENLEWSSFYFTQKESSIFYNNYNIDDIFGDKFDLKKLFLKKYVINNLKYQNNYFKKFYQK